MIFLDDEFLVSGSRDSVIALWRFRPNPQDFIDCGHVPLVRKQFSLAYPIIPCVASMNTHSEGVEKIRALSYNYRLKVLSAVSLDDSKLLMLDMRSLSQVRLMRLTGNRYSESVCLCHNEDETVRSSLRRSVLLRLRFSCSRSGRSRSSRCSMRDAMIPFRTSRSRRSTIANVCICALD